MKYLFICLILLSIPANAKPLFTWSQVVNNNQLSVRAIVLEDEQCPIVNVDDQELEMSVRAFPQKGVFNDKVCELLVPQTTSLISIDNVDLPVISRKIRKIAVIGDTGCIVSLWGTRLSQQHCMSSEEWPLKKILSNISAHNPDLVIHVGDYLYRAVQCIDVERCGNVYGDNSETWKADWLDPSMLLSGKAPFLFVRGNHENCDRSYMGWFRYLDPYQYSSSSDRCQNFTDSWEFNARELDSKNIDFYIFDSSFGNEKNVLDSDIEHLKKQFLPLLKSKSSSVWFLTHRPVWSYAVLKGKAGNLYYGNLAQQEAFGDLFPDNVSVILSGHVHLSQVLDLKSKKQKHIPMQIIVGNSGALLHAVPKDMLLFEDVEMGDVVANTVKSDLGFGFTIVEIQESKDVDNVMVTFYNSSGEKVRQFYTKS